MRVVCKREFFEDFVDRGGDYDLKHDCLSGAGSSGLRGVGQTSCKEYVTILHTIL